VYSQQPQQQQQELWVECVRGSYSGRREDTQPTRQLSEFHVAAQ